MSIKDKIKKLLIEEELYKVVKPGLKIITTMIEPGSTSNFGKTELKVGSLWTLKPTGSKNSVFLKREVAITSFGKKQTGNEEIEISKTDFINFFKEITNGKL